MRERISALLISERPADFVGLRVMLESREIQVHTARSCGEAILRLWSSDPPHLVFTETQLADGTWADVLTMAEKSPLPVNVIVISRIVDISLYVQVLERGAFDFIVPPLEISELDHVLRCAVGNAVVRRALDAAGKPAHSTATPRSSTTQEDSLLVDEDYQAASTV